jgi:hypothetical protein
LSQFAVRALLSILKATHIDLHIMKKYLLPAFALVALSLFVPTAAFAGGNKAAKGAGKGDKTERKEEHTIFAKYDKNGNGVLDPDEREALKKDFETDATLKVLDKNTDGKLDDSEIEALKPGHKGKNGAGGKAGKKGAAAATTAAATPAAAAATDAAK